MRSVFLTGFMGAGKSVVGRRVAERLGWPFVDLDIEIERREGASIPDIFRLRGEAGFRQAEHDALAALVEQGHAVVATGGGAVLRADNQSLLRRFGSVVYLAVSAEEAMARLGDTSSRPLLSGQGVDTARAVLAARLPVYAATADMVVETDGKREEQVADEVLDALRALGPADLPIAVTNACGQHAYDVLVRPGALREAGALIRPFVSGAAVALVTDETVWPLLGESVKASLESAGLAVSVHVVPAGESSKSWERAGELLEAFAAAGLDRSSAVVALGGGVVGDLAGFCAATYMRGISLVHLPTTLLAQVDSAIGGKTGVDLAAGKNLAGAFWPPSLVLADTEALATLPPAEWTNGLVEMVKGAFLEGGDALLTLEGHLEAIVARQPESVERAVRRAAAFKAGVVSADFREADLRECLNYGHTLGHALERLVGYGSLPHGLAVAEGMRFASRLAEVVLGAPASVSERVEGVLDAIGAGEELCAAFIRPAADRLAPERLLGAMKSDKKSKAGAVRFVLLEEPGRWRAVTLGDAQLLAELERWSHDVAGGE